jgi:hypothetical protein
MSSRQDKGNTDVTVYLNTGDTVTYRGVSDDKAREIEDTYTNPQVVEVVAVKGKRG